jgi:signal transduction histidine kinase
MATHDQIMAALGKAVFAAQNFELNVGTLLLYLTVEVGDRKKFQTAEGTPNEAAVLAFLDEVDILTLGQLKGKLEALKVLDATTIDLISSINQTRKRLIHYFVADYSHRLETPEERLEVLAELEDIETRLRDAWHNLQAFLAVKALEHQARR